MNMQSIRSKLAIVLVAGALAALPSCQWLEGDGPKAGSDGQYIYSDSFVKAFCLEHFDTNNDGELSLDEVSGVTKIEICTDSIRDISDFGIFPDLDTLICSSPTGNGLLTEIGVHRIKYLDCSGNRLKYLNLSGFSELTTLDCSHCELEALEVLGGAQNLSVLKCSNNKLKTLIINGNPILKEFDCSHNLIESIDFLNSVNLESLDCSGNSISLVDFTRCNLLKHLAINDNPCSSINFVSLDLISFECSGTPYGDSGQFLEFPNLTHLDCSRCGQTELQLQNNKKLVSLNCSGNKLTSLSLDSTQLKDLNCSGNRLTKIDFNNSKNIIDLDCSGNAFQKIDFGPFTKLKSLKCGGNAFVELDLTGNKLLTYLDCSNSPYLRSITVSSISRFTTFIYDTDIATVYYK